LPNRWARRWLGDRHSLPGRFARNLPAIHEPLLLLMTYLHGRNLRRQRLPLVAR